MKSYKGATPKMRMKNLALAKKAMAAGLLKKHTVCQRCGQDKGIIQAHCEDYEKSLFFLERNDYAGAEKYREGLCWTCHMVHHSARRAPEACKAYWQRVNDGWRPPPVFKHNFKELHKYGIY